MATYKKDIEEIQNTLSDTLYVDRIIESSIQHTYESQESNVVLSGLTEAYVDEVHSVSTSLFVDDKIYFDSCRTYFEKNENEKYDLKVELDSQLPNSTYAVRVFINKRR